MPRRIRDTGGQLYQLKATLQRIPPPIWRRFLVPADITLGRLHDALQLAMGWTDSHLHQFEAQGVRFGPRGRQDDCTSENATRLDQVLRRPKDKLTYEYDFGDSWVHELLLERVIPVSDGGLFPGILDGKRACPPEDVGGAAGYARLLAILADRGHPEYEEMLDWVGGDFDPEAYDARRANLGLHCGWTQGEIDV